jgi:hypothetical protein
LYAAFLSNGENESRLANFKVRELDSNEVDLESFRTIVQRHDPLFEKQTLVCNFLAEDLD